MSIPCNPTDYARFCALAKTLSEKTPPVEMSIYVSSSDKGSKQYYVSIEMKGGLSYSEVNAAFGIQP